ncbi:toprim domain-containing protein [Sporosarcina beigongshangi]|uniref:toprim domain-containing protein n=1 Tax=Sporosarcina beigongshangi TaxID=2782538 RepID=UPI001939521A|nr:toprim domain-containing protein [Sporosarcina beigongshangi]
MTYDKVIVVEGSADKKRLARILAEPVDIICTNGTVSPYRLEELLAPYEQHELYVFVDADESGEKIRTLVRREFPNAIHLYTEKVYKEVETTPYQVLATILLEANFALHSNFTV